MTIKEEAEKSLEDDKRLTQLERVKYLLMVIRANQEEIKECEEEIEDIEKGFVPTINN